MISVIFPAAGQGKRMNLGYNKVYVDLHGEPIFLKTLRQFINYPGIEELIIVVDPERVDFISNILKKLEEFSKCKVVAGGKERQESVYNGLQAVSENADIVLVHDAARPMVTWDIIERVIEGVKEVGAAICGVPAKDTIAKIDENSIIEDVPNRKKLLSIQTPQGFYRELLMEAHEQARRENFLGTDEGSLVRRLGKPVKVVEGSYENIKVTTKSDLILVEYLGRKQEFYNCIKISQMISEEFEY